MNSIHSTHKATSYGVIGGQGAGLNERAVLPCTVVILHRGEGYERSELFDRFHRLNAKEVISVETNKDRPDIEAIASTYKEFKFLVYTNPVNNIGQMINHAIKESSSRFVFVVWSNAQIMPVSKSYFTEFSETPSLVVLPYIRSNQNNIIPSLPVPAEFKDQLKIVHVPPSPHDSKGLFPHDFQGLYDKEQFMASMGYDEEIDNPYWQKMDFGFRAWLWGFNMKASAGLRLQVLTDAPVENTDITEDYARFYARNLLPEFDKDHAVIKPSSLFNYSKAVGKSIFGARKSFNLHKSWISETKWRFRQDAKNLVNLWEGV